MLLLLSVFLLITLCVYYKISRRVLEKFAKNIPGDDGLPIIGNITEFIKAKTLSGIFYKIHELTDKHSEGGVMKFWLGTKLMLIVWDPEYIEVVANSPHTANKGSMYSFLFGSIARGVGVVDGGAVWKELRRPLTKALTKRLVEKDYLEVFIRQSNAFTHFLKQNREGKSVDVLQDVEALTFGIVLETHFGLVTNELWERRWNFTQIMHNLGLVVNMIMKYHFYLWKVVYRFTSTSALLDDTLDHLSRLQRWILDERRKCINDGKEVDSEREYYPDFLLRRGKEKNISDTQLHKELTDVTVAGVDTTGVTVSSILVFLAMFPEVQHLVNLELEDLFRDSACQPTLQDLYNLPYMEMVIKEALRHVSAPGIMKSCQQHLSIGKYTIPKGSYIYVFMNRVHHDPKYWERPHSFYPEHFLPETEAKRPTFAYIPFGIGPRACPGSLYAMIKMKVILSAILRSFRVTTNKKFDDIIYDYNIMLLLDSYEVKFEGKK